MILRCACGNLFDSTDDGIVCPSCVGYFDQGLERVAPCWMSSSNIRALFPAAVKGERDAEIRQRLTEGERVQTLASEYELTPSRIYQIRQAHA